MSSIKNLKDADNLNIPSHLTITNKTHPNNNQFFSMLFNSKSNFNNTLAKTDNYSYIQKINVMSINLYVPLSDLLNQDFYNSTIIKIVQKD